MISTDSYSLLKEVEFTSENQNNIFPRIMQWHCDVLFLQSSPADDVGHDVIVTTQRHDPNAN